jgi:hypothetical protein
MDIITPEGAMVKLLEQISNAVSRNADYQIEIKGELAQISQAIHMLTAILEKK